MPNLILTRMKDERIIVGDRVVTITVVDIRGNKVRLGIEAPQEMSVHREEVFDTIVRERSRKLTEPPSGP